MKVVTHPKCWNNCCEYIDSQIANFPVFAHFMKLLATLSCHEEWLTKHQTPNCVTWLPAAMARARHSKCRRGCEYKYLLRLKPGRSLHGQNLITWTWPAPLLCKNHNENLLHLHSSISSWRQYDDPACQDAVMSFDTSEGYSSHFVQHCVISWKVSTTA